MDLQDAGTYRDFSAGGFSIIRMLWALGVTDALGLH